MVSYQQEISGAGKGVSTALERLPGRLLVPTAQNMFSSGWCYVSVPCRERHASRGNRERTPTVQILLGAETWLRTQPAQGACSTDFKP